MMSIHCPRHGHEVLIGHRQILGIEGHGHDLAIHWVCWCGQHGTSRPHGRRTAAATTATTAHAA